jgi:hypothetical protein
MQSSRACSESIKQSESSGDLNLAFCNMTDIELMLKRWWKELDSIKALRVHINTVADFLAAKKFVGNRHEGRRLLTYI